MANTGIATFDLSNPGSTGIKINGTLGGSTLPVQGGANIVQNTAPTGSQYNGGSVLPTASKPATPVDPYKGTVFGSTAGYNKAVGDFNSTKNSAFSSINDVIGSNAGQFGGSIQDYLDTRATAQKGIDSKSVQNELSRRQGQQGILDMVGNGIKSGGVVLGNANASSSSAAEALARAYGTVGRQQSSQVGNQFAQGQNAINAEQDALYANDATAGRKLGQTKTDTINSIVNTARSQLASLNQYAASASLPDRIDIEAKIAQVKQQALDALSSYDSALSGGISRQAPQSGDATRKSAQELLTAGTAPESQFNFTSEVPAELQGTGDFSSSLPIFTLPRRRVTA